MSEVFPQDLIRGLYQNRGVLVVGPGISRAAGLTLREALLDAMSNRLRRTISVSEAQDLEAFLEQASPPEIAQALHDQLGEEDFRKFVRAHLEPKEVPPPPLLLALRALPFRTILTTNFDELLERTYANPMDDHPDLDIVIPVSGQKDPIPAADERPVLVKLFGDVRHPESLILTSDEYEAYFRLRPDLVIRLKTLLEVGAILFIGYHPRDPEFRRIYSQIGALLARAHKRAYAIFDGVNRFELSWWSRRSLSVLGCPAGVTVEQLLRNLNRHYTKHTRPGLELEPETSEHDSVGAAAAWSLRVVLKAQLEQTARQRLLPEGHTPVDLRLSYVPQNLLPEVGEEREQNLGGLLRTTHAEGLLRLQQTPRTDIHLALETTPRMLVLGPAGAGKTSLLLHLLYTKVEAALERGEQTLIAYLPVGYIARAPTLSLMECLVEYLSTLVPDEPRDQLDSALMDALLEGKTLLLLDGLDEVQPEEELSVFERLKAFFNDCPSVRMVITCRTVWFEPEKVPESLRLSPYGIAGLTAEQQNAFIRDRLRMFPELGESLIAILRAHLVPWAERLAPNPLHLSQMCVMYQFQQRFAENRGALYRSYLGTLLRRVSPGKEHILYASDKELILQAIALRVMLSPHEALTEEVMWDTAEREISRHHIAPRKNANKSVEAREAIDEIIRESGIVVGPDPRRAFEFRHNALREYLTAQRLATVRDPEGQDIIAAHLADKRWTGVWRLVAAISDDATDFLEKLDAKTGGNIRTLSRSFGDSVRVHPRFLEKRISETGATRALGSLLARLKNQLTQKEKLELFGEILWRDQETWLREERRTDTRSLFVALSGLQQMIDEEGLMSHQAAETISGWRGRPPGDGAEWPCPMVKIPAGSFHFGDPERLNSRFVQVDAFEMGRAPITVSQYRGFDPSYGGGATSEAEPSDYPVAGVTWYDAWVSACWFGSRLPTAMEWEKAAGWDPILQEKRIYPWGQAWDATRANTLESWESDGQAVPVEHYAEVGASAFGCIDMAGNVMEWTVDEGGGVPERRVLKGGNFQSSPLIARVGSAVWLKPGFSGKGVGLRLAR